MNAQLRKGADTIVASAIHAVQPDEAMAQALSGRSFTGRVLLTDQLCCQAREAGSLLASTVKTHIGDGTDVPTDAAGGYVDGDTCGELLQQGVEIEDVLRNNDAYHALEKTGGLIITGAAGTNVNDVAVALIR